ncbi:MAG TPA: hypothetical protein PKU69_05205, partial [Bacillota bacterium]|nr:hypothetical protein [Bacillota bacterium]
NDNGYDIWSTVDAFTRLGNTIYYNDVVIEGNVLYTGESYRSFDQTNYGSMVTVYRDTSGSFIDYMIYGGDPNRVIKNFSSLSLMEAQEDLFDVETLILNDYYKDHFEIPPYILSAISND